MDFFKEKYDKADGVDIDLCEGIGLAMDFMTNFGVRFEDQPQGLYCHVIDI